MRTVLRAWRGDKWLCLTVTAFVIGGSVVLADVVTLKNGMTLEGSVAPIVSVGADPAKAGNELRQIVLVDDQLTRTFISTKQLAKELGQAPAIALERIPVKQRVATVGRQISSVGPIVNVDAFDEWGRRTFTMNTLQGNIDIVQGITEITPKWTKVEAIQGTNSYVWTMRMATSSIPREQLSKILYRALDAKNPQDRLRIVRLYLQSERFQEARIELEQLLKEFPDLAHLKEQVKVLHQLFAQRLLKEIGLRRDAGQYRLVIDMLQRFPADGVAGETLLEVRESLEALAALKTKGDQVKTQLPLLVAALKDEGSREGVKGIVEEVTRDLNIHNLDRMADYLRLSEDTALSAEQKLSLAISGWMLGSGSAIENLAVSKSLVKVREIVRKYLATARQPDRELVLQELTSLEGATLDYIPKIVANMKPPLEVAPSAEAVPEAGNPATAPAAPAGEAGAGSQEAGVEEPPAPAESPAEPPLQPVDGIAGLFELSVTGVPEEPQFKYRVQLPPEYDPYRRYPCIVTLNGAGSTPQQQIDWWAGDYVPQEQTRYGQAARHGYIVIAPRWTREHQRKYEYSSREWAAVLFTLQHALKRFSIDADRVFLSGHSMGGDAAWDIGLAHPDLWAGVIPIVATADKYVFRYWENGKHVPMYFVSGEKDGNKLASNASEWDRYLKTIGFDATVVQYQGRGHEDFHDEIQNLFTWMNLYRRTANPRKFVVSTLRPWDNSFWWVETKEPKENTVILPAEWGNEKRSAKDAKEAEVVGTVLATNGVSVSAGAHKKVTVWLSPDIVSFDKPLTVRIKGQSVNKVQPSIPTLLEDVRTRGDRQRPFWAKVEN